MDRKPFVLGLLLLAPVFAQTEEAKPEQPPDQKAYNAAKALNDNAAKAAALRKFTNDFPKSTRVIDAESGIFTALIKTDPANRKAILKQAHRLMKTAKHDLYDWANTIASQLDADCTFYREAERYSNKSLRLLSESNFLRKTAELYRNAKMPVPNGSDLHREFLEQRSFVRL